MIDDTLGMQNPFAPGSAQTTTAAPDIGDVVEYAVRRTGLDLRVCMPAKITMVRGPQLVDVQPLLRQLIYNKTEDYPVITGVLVSMPVGTDYALTLPIAVGDCGLVVFADRALDAYIASNAQSPVEPVSDRTHHLTDAIFIPGLVPTARQTSPTTDLVLRNGKAEVRVQKAGTVTISNGVNELLDLVSQLIQQLAAAQVLTAFGPAPFLASNIVSFNEVLAKLQTLKGG